jgi:hypothetical protein
MLPIAAARTGTRKHATPNSRSCHSPADRPPQYTQGVVQSAVAQGIHSLHYCLLTKTRVRPTVPVKQAQASMYGALGAMGLWSMESL